MHFRLQSDVPAPATPLEPSDPTPCVLAYAIPGSADTAAAGSNRQRLDRSSRIRRCHTKTVEASILVDDVAVDGEDCGAPGPVRTH